jgi:hypothetical protein
MDALDVRELGEPFDFVLCFGILAVCGVSEFVIERPTFLTQR